MYQGSFVIDVVIKVKFVYVILSSVCRSGFKFPFSIDLAYYKSGSLMFRFVACVWLK